MKRNLFLITQKQLRKKIEFVSIKKCIKFMLK